MHVRQFAADRARAWLAFWEAECPTIASINFTVPAPDRVGQQGDRLERYAGSASAKRRSTDKDPGLDGGVPKSAAGGSPSRKPAIADLEAAALKSDLVVVAAGKNDVRKISSGMRQKPVRGAAAGAGADLRHRHGAGAPSIRRLLQPDPDRPASILCSRHSTTSGPVRSWCSRAFPAADGLLGRRSSPEQHLEKSKWILDTFLPWEGARNRSSELTDATASCLRLRPTVRRRSAAAIGKHRARWRMPWC